MSVKVSRSRQGKLWSKYRCHCGSDNASYCVCPSTIMKNDKEKTLKDLACYVPLFAVNSPERIHPSMSMDWRSGLFK